MAAEVEGCEFDVADGEFFGCWRGSISQNVWSRWR